MKVAVLVGVTVAVCVEVGVSNMGRKGVFVEVLSTSTVIVGTLLGMDVCAELEQEPAESSITNERKAIRENLALYILIFSVIPTEIFI